MQLYQISHSNWPANLKQVRGKGRGGGGRGRYWELEREKVGGRGWRGRARNHNTMFGFISVEQLTLSLDDEREQNNALKKKNASNLKVGVVLPGCGLLIPYHCFF